MNYEPSTGLLLSKRDAENQGATYTYTPDGKLLTRTWARGVVTTYGYDSANRLVTTTYSNDSDLTPDVTLAYDRLGRPTSQSNGLATSSFSYDPLTLLLDTETLSYDFNGDATPDLVRVLDRSQDALSRSSGYQLKNGSTIEAAASYQYSPTTGRLESVDNGTDTFTYAYTTNSSLLASVTKSGTPTIQTTHTWEANRNVLDVKENKVGSTVISSYHYTVNTLGQRTAVDTAGTAFAAGERDRAWSYDALGQVIKEDYGNNTTADTRDRVFGYDSIGNRKSTAVGSLTLPGSDTYTANSLNQYTSFTEGGPAMSPIHDEDGNATTWALRTGGLGSSTQSDVIFVWDGENRLIEIKDAAGATTLASYTYDSQSRRIARTVGGTTLATIYDGWNPIAEYSGTPATGYSLQASYSWGLDLSGSMQGAGGVGGLLSVTSGSTSFYPTYDGNGNVSEYLDAAGAIAAHYEYDAFGNVIFSSGPSASSFQHRFSTKPQDEESGLYYYGYRCYDPVMGRWPSRDPIGERGGVNLYGFVGNNGVNRSDYLGREEQKAKEAAEVKLEIELSRLQIGNCGNFRLDVKFKVDGKKDLKGFVFQSVHAKSKIWGCEPGDEENPSTDEYTTREAWAFPFKREGGDTWSNSDIKLLNGEACRGEIELSAEAYFVSAVPDLLVHNPTLDRVWPEKPFNHDPFTFRDDPPWLADLALDPLTEPLWEGDPKAISNKKTRTLKATWNCCEGDSLTKIWIDGKESTPFDNLKKGGAK
jgi:RHS repeat-associated protein